MRVLMPGSYDPVTCGHLAVIEEAAARYDEVTVAVFINPKKQGTFSYRERVALLRLATAHLDNVQVDFSDGMVADYARAGGFDLIVKGIRNDADRAYEQEMADYNLAHSGVPTELIEARGGMAHVSSTAAREALAQGKSLAGLVPEAVIPAALSAYREKK